MTATNHSDTLLQRLADHYPIGEARFLLRCLIEDLLNKLTVDTDEEAVRLNHAIDELLNGKALQYVTGVAWFFRMKFLVDQRVLIPRPETEELVEWILDDHNEQPLRLLDIGTGSGCIPIALKRFRPEWHIEGCDVSTDALKVAKRNAESNNAQVSLFEMDVTRSFEPKQRYDVIVSNPPYVTADEAHTLATHVIDYEPRTALFAPVDQPLFFYDAIIQFAANHLNDDGAVYVEINQQMAEETLALFASYFRIVEMRLDLSGNFRMLYANGLKDRVPHD
jgi:release factor glutamine methyltransferase